MCGFTLHITQHNVKPEPNRLSLYAELPEGRGYILDSPDHEGLICVSTADSIKYLNQGPALTLRLAYQSPTMPEIASAAFLQVSKPYDQL